MRHEPPSAQRRRSATYAARAALASVLLLPACSTAQQSSTLAAEPFPQEPAAERIAADQLAGAGPLHVGAKRIGPYVDRVFRDSFGREVLLRGYNVTSRTLLTRGGLTPFADLEQASRLTDLLRLRTGANVARFLISWEGAHPEVDRIDTDYLRTIAEQIRVVTERGIYVVLDYHQDNFSRHLVPHGHGDGAPAWVTPGLPRRPCGPPCVDSAQHYLVNRSVRAAFRNFWDNAEFPTSAGPRRLQDEFLWQLARVLAYLREALPPATFERVLGVEPMNEPVDGGRRGMSAAAWDNEELWPFYRRVRGVLDDSGWGTKLVFAGPSAFWNTNLGLPGGNQGLLRTGGGHLSEPPGPGYAFAPHFYDIARLGGLVRGPPGPDAYFRDFDRIRTEGRFLDLPVFVGEFGSRVTGGTAPDPARMIGAVHVGLAATGVRREQRLHLEAPPLSAAQWEWGIHSFSVVAGDEAEYRVDPHLVERAWPRRIQGDLLSFGYHARARDRAGNELRWLALKPAEDGPSLLDDRRFILVLWRGRRSAAPTEVFMPRHMAADRLVVVSEDRVTVGFGAEARTGDSSHALLPDAPGGGSRLLVWDDPDPGEDHDTVHFVLAADGVQPPRPGMSWEAFRRALVAWLRDPAQPARSPLVWNRQDRS